MKFITALQLLLLVALFKHAYTDSLSFFDLDSIVQAANIELKITTESLNEGGDVEQNDFDNQIQLRKYQRFFQEATQDLDQFLKNPVNEFLLSERIAKWNVLTSSSDNYTDEGNDGGNELDLPRQLPRTEVNVAAFNLIRLQVTYLLDTYHLSEGKVSGPGIDLQTDQHKQYPMNAGECLEMGRNSYLIGEDNYAEAWLNETWRKYEKEEKKTASIIDILQYNAFVSFKLGKMETATNLTQRLLQILPGGQEQLMEIYEDVETLRDDYIVATGQEEHDENYKALCRGEQVMDQSERDRLYCSYTSSFSGYLKLQPVKQEWISLHPQIVIYHDFLSDEEIETIKKLAEPKLLPVRGTSAYTGEPAKNSRLRRIGNGADLDNGDLDHPVLKRITRRLKEVTGLEDYSSTNSYPFGVLTYTIGDHFSPHCDFSRNDTLTPEVGDSLATLSLYLSDVEIGGSTVFPIAKTRVPASRGSVAFWYNLKSNGRGNEATLHASCPILSGFKWLATHFVNTPDQQLHHQCNLDYNSDELMAIHV